MNWLLGAAGFWAAVVVLGFVSYRRHDTAVTLPEGVTDFRAYLPHWFKRHPIALGISVLAWLAGGVTWGLVALGIAATKLQSKPKMKYRSEKQMNQDAIAATETWLAGLGATHADRVTAIEAMFAERTATLAATHFGQWTGYQGQVELKGHMSFEVRRSLAAMDNREREYLRLAELLNSGADGKNADYRAWRAALIWGDGKGVLGPTEWQGIDASITNHMAHAIEKLGLRVDVTVNKLLRHVDELKTRPKLDPALASLRDQATERLTQTGSSWLRSGDLSNTIFAPSSEHGLRIGSLADGSTLTYSGDGSMITIAPPGSGKTQCNVFPNLLSWKGPAVVLDISGDIYENTSKWRAEHVGPVYKYSPLEPETSHHYNPLTFVRSEPDYIWEDARLLAELMIVPSAAADQFWDAEARTVLTAAIAHICYANPPGERPMHAVLDIIFGGQAWEDMILGLRTAVDVRTMVQHANALSTMNEKTLASVLQTARSSLRAWSGERIARVTGKSDWSPLDLRGPGMPTIYIYLRPNEVESYLSLLRVFIGQHIRMLTGGPVPPRGSPPILFMLDELPRLKHMPPIDEALNIGRKYGIRLWMFAQSVGQLKTAYENADGMLGSCAVRIFMNPSGADGMTEKLAEEIGYVDSLNDGSRKKLVEAAELAGPAYRDHQVVLGLATRPAKVKKEFAWQDPDIKTRMGSL